jgi:hypothetical protein
MDSPVERTLDELFDRLAGTGAAGRRSLTEAEDHLRSGVAEGLARGLDQTSAEEEAVQRFGSPATLAGQLRFAHDGIGGLLRTTFVGAWLIGALGLVTIGLSGLLNEVFGRTFGPGFVAGDPSGVTYTPERCADYFEYDPTAANCGEAAAFHHWGEVVEGRVAVGVLGLLALAAFGIARRTGLRAPRWPVPSGYVAAVLVAGFGAAGVLLTGVSVMQMSFGGRSGVGVNLSDGLIAALAALVVAVWVVARTRHRSRVSA